MIRDEVNRTQEGKTVTGDMNGSAVVLGDVLAVGLFILLPAFLVGFLPDSVPHLAANLLEGVVRIAIFIGYMWLMSLIPDMKRTFRYHGAEHKTIY